MKKEKMTKTNHSWQIATNIIPPATELVCENAVRTDRFPFGAALVRCNGRYYLCQNYCIYKVNQKVAAEFAESL